MCFEHATDHVAWEGLVCGVVGEGCAVVFDEAFEDGAEPEVPVAVFERGSGVLGELGRLSGVVVLGGCWVEESELGEEDCCDGGDQSHGWLALLGFMRDMRRVHDL